nr:MAG TPA: hypothetical protein [Caudoviricetes sp.]
MIDVVIGCLLGVLGGAVMSPLLHKWLTKKLTKKISLHKGGFMRIYLPNKLQMTIWDSYSDDGSICVCVNHDGENKVTDGEIVYFNKTSVSKIRGKNFYYDRQEI